MDVGAPVVEASLRVMDSLRSVELMAYLCLSGELLDGVLLELFVVEAPFLRVR